MPMAAITALQAFATSRDPARQKVLINCASGGVGTAIGEPLQCQAWITQRWTHLDGAPQPSQ